jgi:hypothetical protein
MGGVGTEHRTQEVIKNVDGFFNALKGTCMPSLLRYYFSSDHWADNGLPFFTLSLATRSPAHCDLACHTHAPVKGMSVARMSHPHAPVKGTLVACISHPHAPVKGMPLGATASLGPTLLVRNALVSTNAISPGTFSSVASPMSP